MQRERALCCLRELQVARIISHHDRAPRRFDGRARLIALEAWHLFWTFLWPAYDVRVLEE